MEIRYIDAHCHLQFPEYDADRDAVIEEMRTAGIAGIVVGTDLESSRAAVALAERHEHLYASVGLHPNNVKDIVSPSFDEGLTMSKLREFATHPKVVAIGECGLDYFRSDNKEKQIALFRAHLLFAQEVNKPLIIHCRPSKGTTDAYDDLVGILQNTKTAYPNLRGDIHFFVGGEREARAFAALGFTVSYTAVTTFARDYDATIRSLPLNSLLVETDAPYVAPASRRGKRNDPLAIPEIVAALASIRGEEPEVIRRSLLVNTGRLFGLPIGAPEKG